MARFLGPNPTATRKLALTSALAALIPKCPLCIAAYLSLLGVGADAAGALAPALRPLGLAFCAAMMALVIRELVRFAARSRRYAALSAALASTALLLGLAFVGAALPLRLAAITGFLASVLWLSRAPSKRGARVGGQKPLGEKPRMGDAAGAPPPAVGAGSKFRWASGPESRQP